VIQYQGNALEMASLKRALFRRGSTKDGSGKKDEGPKVFTYSAADLKLHRPLTYIERELSEVCAYVVCIH